MRRACCRDFSPHDLIKLPIGDEISFCGAKITMAFDTIHWSKNINLSIYQSINPLTSSIRRSIKNYKIQNTEYLVGFVAANSARNGRLLPDYSVRVDRVLTDPPDIQGRLQTRYYSYTDSSVGYFAEIDPRVRKLDLRRSDVKIRCQDQMFSCSERRSGIKCLLFKITFISFYLHVFPYHVIITVTRKAKTKMKLE